MVVVVVVCELCMRVESPTGFKTTTRHPASRQMCSKPRDKTRDDSSSFVKPFSGWDGREGEGRGRGGRRGIAVFETNEISGERHLLLHSLSGAVCHYSRGIRVAKDIPRFPFRKLVSKGILSRGERVANRVGRIHFRPILVRFAIPRGIARRVRFKRAMIFVT